MKKFTLTSVFLLPILPIALYELEQFGFQNAYLGDDKYVEETGLSLENCVCLLFNVQLNNLYQNFEEKLKNLPLYEFSYDPEVGQTVYVFRLPEDSLPELEKFKQGRFSEISDEFISKYYKESYDAYKICKKDNYFREFWEQKLDAKIDEDLEVWHKPTRANEVYRASSDSNDSF